MRCDVVLMRLRGQSFWLKKGCMNITSLMKTCPACWPKSSCTAKQSYEGLKRRQRFHTIMGYSTVIIVFIDKSVVQKKNNNEEIDTHCTGEALKENPINFRSENQKLRGIYRYLLEEHSINTDSPLKVYTDSYIRYSDTFKWSLNNCVQKSNITDHAFIFKIIFSQG